MAMEDVAEMRCPECTAGKCGNCDGSSWSHLLDSPAACPCSVNGHPSLKDRAEAEAKVAELRRDMEALKAKSVPTASVGCGTPPSPAPAGDVPSTARAGDRHEALAATYLAKLERVEALADRLRSSHWGPAQECGTFVREAVDGTLDGGDLDAFLRGRP